MIPGTTTIRFLLAATASISAASSIAHAGCKTEIKTAIVISNDINFFTCVLSLLCLCLGFPSYFFLISLITSTIMEIIYPKTIMEMSRNVQSGNTQNLKSMVCHCVDADYAQNKKQEETNMTIDSAKDLQMNIAKEGLALLMLHPSLDVQLHRECIFLIGTAWDIPVGDTQEVISLLDRELDAIRAAGEGGTVAHVLPEDELSMNAIGLETLDNIWDLFETSLRMDSMQARTKMFEMAKWLEESQNLLD